LERLELDPLFMNWIENALFKRITRDLLDEPVLSVLFIHPAEPK
jgi:hypothetical protein